MNRARADRAGVGEQVDSAAISRDFTQRGRLRTVGHDDGRVKAIGFASGWPRRDGDDLCRSLQHWRFERHSDLGMATGAVHAVEVSRPDDRRNRSVGAVASRRGPRLSGDIASNSPGPSNPDMEFTALRSAGRAAATELQSHLRRLQHLNAL